MEEAPRPLRPVVRFDYDSLEFQLLIEYRWTKLSWKGWKKSEGLWIPKRQRKPLKFKRQPAKPRPAGPRVY